MTGLLPPIVHSSQNQAGMWCEFDRDWQSNRAASIRPVVWFKFWTKFQAYGYLQAISLLLARTDVPRVSTLTIITSSPPHLTHSNTWQAQVSQR